MSNSDRKDMWLIGAALVAALVLLVLWMAGDLPFITDFLNYFIEQAGAPREG
jgi:hypothetical protein